MILDKNSNFPENIIEKLKTVTKCVNLLQKLNLALPCYYLLIMYKSFVMPHLDYNDLVCYQANNSSLSEKIESPQYNAALAVTGALKGSSKEKFYQDSQVFILKRKIMGEKIIIYKILSSRFPIHTPLGGRPGLGTQPRNKALGDLRFEYVKCSD